jgi:hypothetical protein
MNNWAIIGYTVMANKLHLDTKGIDRNGTPNCGQGRIVSIEFDGTDPISMKTAATRATNQALQNGAELCARCFKGVTA